MKIPALIGASALGLAALAATVPANPAFADSSTHALFVETDGLSGNQIVSYARNDDGTLALAGTYDTGGLGGQLSGAVADFQASQGALALDSAAGLLLATNAGSNTISVFSVDGTSLDLVQTVDSGGDFPVSVTVSGDLAYVLNARDGGSISGFTIAGGMLTPLAGSTRKLGLDTTASPEFVNTPGQVSFSPGGGFLVVTTKANTNAVDVYKVYAGGRPSATPSTTVLTGSVPFGVAWPGGRQFEVVEAATGVVATFALTNSGAVNETGSGVTDAKASCWITTDGQYTFVSNAASGTVTSFTHNRDGALTQLGATPTDAGTVDLVTSPDGADLYVRAGVAGMVDEYSVGARGVLTPIGSVTVAGAAGGEGIAAS